MTDLTGRSIVITGASSGIGAATARACARAGMDVVVHGRDEHRTRAVAGEVEAAGRRATVIVGDVADPGVTDRLLDAAADLPGGLDAVFANAGYGIDRGFLETTDAELRELFEANFFAACHLVREAARRMLDAPEVAASSRPARARRGHLLMCSSVVAKFSVPGAAAYAATKAAQDSICGGLRHELSPHGIAVSSVHPVTTRTRFFDEAGHRGGDGRAGALRIDRTPGLLVQTPEKVAAAIVRCLRRPRGEVWTSLGARALAASFTLVPRWYDLFMHHLARRVERDRAGEAGAPPRTTG